jgi:hypothetical protein
MDCEAFKKMGKSSLGLVPGFVSMSFAFLAAQNKAMAKK